MADPQNLHHAGSANPHQSEEPAESMLTTPEDVAAAGRSCMAIIILGATIVVVIAIWIVYSSFLGR